MRLKNTSQEQKAMYRKNDVPLLNLYPNTDKIIEFTDKSPRVTVKSLEVTDKNPKPTDKSLKPTDKNAHDY